jgi:hypothetical protein
MTEDGLQSIRIFPRKVLEKNKRICIAGSKTEGDKRNGSKPGPKNSENTFSIWKY